MRPAKLLYYTTSVLVGAVSAYFLPLGYSLLASIAYWACGVAFGMSQELEPKSDDAMLAVVLWPLWLLISVALKVFRLFPLL